MSVRNEIIFRMLFKPLSLSLSFFFYTKTPHASYICMTDHRWCNKTKIYKNRFERSSLYTTFHIFNFNFDELINN